MTHTPCKFWGPDSYNRAGVKLFYHLQELLTGPACTISVLLRGQYILDENACISPSPFSIVGGVLKIPEVRLFAIPR